MTAFRKASCNPSLGRGLCSSLIVLLISATVFGVVIGQPSVNSVGITGSARFATIIEPSASRTNAPIRVESGPSPFGAPTNGTEYCSNCSAPTFWAGAYDEMSYAPSSPPTSLTTTLTTPEANASGGSFYGILLSAFDNSGTYDQIGFDDYWGGGGGWQIVWSVGPDCANLADFQQDYTSNLLADNNQYTFGMTAIASNTTIEFFVTPANSTLVIYSHYYKTGGSYFQTNSTGADKECGSGFSGVDDYSVYEEVKAVTVDENVFPPSEFLFWNNMANGVAVTGWTNLSVTASYPGYSGGNVALAVERVIKGSTVELLNQWYQEWLGNSIGLGALFNVPVAVGGTYNVSGGFLYPCTNLGTLQCVWGNHFSFSVQGIPASWVQKVYPSYLNPSGPSQNRVNVNLSIPKSAKVGQYAVTLWTNATPAPATNYPDGPEGLDGYAYTYTTFILSVTPKGGGGGCVMSGTPILTPSGYVAVQNLRMGQTVTEYSMANGTIVQGELLADNVTTVNEILDINQGLLFLTPTDQPIYIWNSTYSGWLRDPQNLTTSDWLFEPGPDAWVHVTVLQLLHFKAQVYDVVTSGSNNFIANEILLDIKTG